MYVIPQKSKSFVINVKSGGFVMTGLNAYLDLRLSGGPANTPVTLLLNVSGDGLTGSYSILGSEFPDSIVGICDAELRVTNGAGVLLFSLVAIDFVTIQAPITF
jgi:hypothetical protein